MKSNITPTQREVRLADDDIIVSKTDLAGRITYVNRAFMRISDYIEKDVLHQPHNIIRHPDMPRGVFKLLWDTLKAEREFFGYVKNLTSGGDYYWVLANITPDRNPQHEVVGYFSVRRQPSPSAVATMEGLYREMLEVERRAGPAQASAASTDYLMAKLRDLGTTYERFVLGL